MIWLHLLHADEDSFLKAQLDTGFWPWRGY